jgi:hypothetical protein
MKTNNYYTDLIKHAWNLIKKVSMAIVTGIPADKVYTANTRKSTLHLRDEEINAGPEKYYHRPISKPAVEKQTILKESKKQKKHV